LPFLCKSTIVKLQLVMKYKHLFFDLDHTLWDFDTNSAQTLKALYDEYDLPAMKITSFNDFYTFYKAHNHRLWDKYSKGLIKQDELRWKRMWYTLLDFKIGNEKLAKEMSGRYLTILPNQKALFDYTFEILDYLTQKKYQLHIISNGFEEVQFNKLQKADIKKYFTQIITSECSNHTKPQKEIFEYAMQKAGATLKESIMIGDNLDADIQGAINAGMDSIFVNHINATTDLQPTYTIYHLKELEAIL
jgi:putative hydrolase of the HAD superfamily